MRISDWSSDVCSSDLLNILIPGAQHMRVDDTADTDHNRADGGPPHPVNRKAMKTILYPVKQRGQERGLKTRENADANGGKQRPATLWRGAGTGEAGPTPDQQAPPWQRTPNPTQHAHPPPRS